MPSTTKAQRIERVAEIRKLLGQGRAYIQDYARDRWGICENTVDSYIQEATEQLADQDRESIRLDRAVALETYQQILNRAFDAGDLYAEIRARTRMDKLQGLEAPIRSEIKTDREDLTQLSDEELAARIEDGNRWILKRAREIEAEQGGLND